MKNDKRITPRDEFRKHLDEYKHPHYVYEQIGWKFDKQDLPAVERIKKSGERSSQWRNGAAHDQGNYGTPRRSNGSISRPAGNVKPGKGGKK